MSAHSDEEYDFTEFTEDELRAIDSVADAALAPVPHTASLSLNSQVASSLELKETKEFPHSRKSSGFSAFGLTEEEFRLIDESVERLTTNNSCFSSAAGSESSLLDHFAHPRPTYVEVATESLVPSTIATSPAPTLGRSPVSSPGVMNSLYSRFRASRKSLSVSDLVGPVWCEFQFDYGLRGKRHLPPSKRPEVLQTRTGTEIRVQKDVAVQNDRVLKKGTAVHKKLEKEIRPIEVEIAPKTREDIWGLKLFDMLSNIRILIDQGRCREMPVMGFLHGHFITGVIDEVVWTPSPLPSPIVPGAFPPKEQPPSPVLKATNIIHILDNKTREVDNLPRARDALRSRLQLMIYKRLLDGLLTTKKSRKKRNKTARRLSLPDVWKHYSLDPLAPFSPSFLKESAALITTNGLGPEVERATCLKELEDVWNGVVRELADTAGSREQKSDIVSNTLKLVYRKRVGSRKRSKSSSKRHSRESSPGSPQRGKRKSKRVRAESEDVDLQRAIHASLAPGSQEEIVSIQSEISEVMREERKDEGEGLAKESEDGTHTPGSWILHDDDLEGAIAESRKSYKEETGKDAPSPSPPSSLDLESKEKSDDGIIGTVEFEYDDKVLEDHLNDVLDFWHDRRPLRGVAIEDTGRCASCEFSDGCEWLADKHKQHLLKQSLVTNEDEPVKPVASI